MILVGDTVMRLSQGNLPVSVSVRAGKYCASMTSVPRSISVWLKALEHSPGNLAPCNAVL